MKKEEGEEERKVVGLHVECTARLAGARSFSLPDSLAARRPTDCATRFPLSMPRSFSPPSSYSRSACLPLFCLQPIYPFPRYETQSLSLTRSSVFEDPRSFSLADSKRYVPLVLFVPLLDVSTQRPLVCPHLRSLCLEVFSIPISFSLSLYSPDSSLRWSQNPESMESPTSVHRQLLLALIFFLALSPSLPLFPGNFYWFRE